MPVNKQKENKMIRKLKAEEIEVKVKQITAKGCLLLLYKTARVDMQILDETYTPMNWQCDYKLISDNLYCGIGIKSSDGWVWKWDCGIESKEDGEGNEVKGQASDAFKRAGFKVGIGRELYTTPFLWASVETVEEEDYHSKKKKWVLKNKYQKFYVDSIAHDGNNICYIKILDDKNNKIIEWGLNKVMDFEEFKQALLDCNGLNELQSLWNDNIKNFTIEKEKEELTNIKNNKKDELWKAREPQDTAELSKKLAEKFINDNNKGK